jgi:UDP-N-acetylmuramoyl-tripeptide--D-alanyl-D-alanine ligase
MRIIVKEPNIFSTYFKTITNYELEYPISGIATDSREVKKNDLFISIKGKRHNGNNFLKAVSESKASAALVSKLDKKVKLQQILVKNTIETICALAKLWREQYSIPIIAITGSNGKTSTKELLYHVLSDQFKVHATKENHNTILGVSLTLLELNNSFDISILELGTSQLGEIRNLCDISKPTHGLITNISQAHLTGLKSIEKIIHEKGALFNALKNGLSFVNTADKKVRGIEVKGKKVTFGTNSDCDFSAEIKTEKDGTLTLSIDSYIILMGSYNHSFLKNIIAVNAVAQTLGIKKDKLKSKIQSFKTPNGRCSVKKI